MSWSSEIYIGETRPWPDTVRVIRGKTEETLCYMPERKCHIVEDEDTGILTCSECGAVQPEDYTVYWCWCCGARIEAKE